MATDVPDHLRTVAAGSPEEAPYALVELIDRLERDGVLCSAAPAAVPFLVAAACDPSLDLDRRVSILLSVARLGGAREGSPDLARAVLAALTADRDGLGELLAQEPRLAAAAAGLAGRFAGPPHAWARRLHDLRDGAADPVVRADFDVALGLAEGRPPDRASVRAAAAEEWEVERWLEREASGLLGLRISPGSAARLGAILARLAAQRIA